MIANFHEIYNSSQTKQMIYSKITMRENYKNILIAISPIIPHFAQ